MQLYIMWFYRQNIQKITFLKALRPLKTQAYEV